MEQYVLDDLDYRILQLIANDARISFLEVARICNVSGAAVHQRIQKMAANEIISGSQFIINYQRIGYNCSAYVKLKFAPNIKLNDAQNSLYKIMEVAECYNIIATSQLMIKIYAKSSTHLAEILRDKITPFGVIDSEVTMLYGESFHRQIIRKEKEEE